MEKKVVVIKLVSGEELIAFQGNTSFSNETLNLDMAIQLVPYQDGSVGLAPFIAAAKTETLTVRTVDVMFGPLEAHAEFETQYRATIEAISNPTPDGMILPEEKKLIV